jgi:hypothetical protein
LLILLLRLTERWGRGGGSPKGAWGCNPHKIEIKNIILFLYQKNQMAAQVIKIMTTQLTKELAHKEWFRTNAEEKFGLTCKPGEWCSSENKSKNSDADMRCIVSDPLKHPALSSYQIGDELNVSLKTKGGNFTAANLGTTHNASIFQKHIHLSHEEIEVIMFCNDLVKGIKDSLLKQNYKRWMECPKKGKEEKRVIMSMYVYLWSTLINTPERVDNIYQFMNDRTSPFKLCGEELIKTVPYILNPLDKFIQNLETRRGTLRVGDFALRFKSAGGEISSPWKINVELF